jgi:antitoxin YefM
MYFCSDKKSKMTMKTVTVTEFGARAKEYLQEIEDDRDILIISRPRKKSGFVVLNMDEYESLKETAYLLSTQANALRIMQGLKQAEEGKAMIKELNL